MDLTRKIRDRMTKRDLVFLYRGAVTTVNSISLLTLLEREMEGSDFGFVGRKRLFMFVLESLQNMSRHAGDNIYAAMSIVAYTKSDDGYTVTTGNAMDSSEVPELRRKLRRINALKPEEIKKVYREMLDASEISSKGGAGLGLIEMAKKTGNRIDYDFIKINERLHYYILSKTVDSSGKGKQYQGERGGKFNGRPVMTLERLMARNNIYMAWSNHITPDVGKEMLSFTETKLREEEVNAGTQRRVFSILVEVLENIAKYSAGKSAEQKYGMPVAIIKMEKGQFVITTGNLIENGNIAPLEKNIKLVNSYDRKGLKDLYRKRLSQQDDYSESTGNMGLIDIARKSGNELIYSFDRVNDHYSYYILEIKVDDNQTH